jgi:hypothetical protein
LMAIATVIPMTPAPAMRTSMLFFIILFETTLFL